MLARDVMKKPIAINFTADLAQAAQIMNDKRISGLPTIDSELPSLPMIVDEPRFKKCKV